MPPQRALFWLLMMWSDAGCRWRCRVRMAKPRPSGNGGGPGLYRSSPSGRWLGAPSMHCTPRPLVAAKLLHHFTSKTNPGRI